MTKTRSELWRKDREIMVSQALNGSNLVLALSNRLHGTRCMMHEALNLAEPPPYATCAVDNIRRLCNDIEYLAIALILRAKGLTCESDEIIAEAVGEDIEEDSFSGYAPYTPRH